MNERELAEKLHQLGNLAQQTHDAVIRLDMRLGDGPGLSFPCIQHGERVESVAKRLENVERRVWYMIGGVAMLVFAINMFSPLLRHLLRLP